jgi:hypothetical protein
MNAFFFHRSFPGVFPDLSSFCFESTAVLEPDFEKPWIPTFQTVSQFTKDVIPDRPAQPGLGRDDELQHSLLRGNDRLGEVPIKNQLEI